MVGIFMTTFNLVEKTKKAITSLCDNTRENFKLVVIDNNSNDGTIEWLKENNIGYEVDKVGNNISAAFNQGINYFLNDLECDYIGTVHNDMEFYPGWLSVMIKFIEDKKLTGKFSPDNSHHRGLSPEESVARMKSAWDGKEWVYHSGNECPWICTADIFRKDNIFFDENYVGIGGYDDWDFNRMLVNAGHEVIILEDAWIWHEQMGTRKHLNTNHDAYANAVYYYKKWGTGEPGV